MSGTLTICGTPIGNLEDITLRSLRILKEADIIAAEDTRHTLKLLNFYGIRCPLTSYHEHNRFEKGPHLINLLLEGKNIALVTDAGMPCISDPGWELVALCHEAGIEVTAAPGPTAVITALTISGLPLSRFVFEGFLPREKKERVKVLEQIRKEPRTVVLYEAPHKLLSTLKELETLLGERQACAARELTKKHEEVIRLTIGQLREHFCTHEPRGEFVLVIEGNGEEEQDVKADWEGLSPREHVERYMEQGYDKKESMKRTAQDRGISKREIYKELI